MSTLQSKDEFKLASFLAKNGVSVTEFALALGVSRQTASRVVNKRCVPSVELASRIAKYTSGRVSVADLVSTKECPRCGSVVPA